MMNFFRKFKSKNEPEAQGPDDFSMPMETAVEPAPVKPIKKLKKKIKMPKAIKNKIAKPKADFDAPEDKFFWVNNGAILRNLTELKEALFMMSDEQFDFHTKREGNDFANWIIDVFGEKGLAGKIKKAKDKVAAANVIEKYFN